MNRYWRVAGDEFSLPALCSIVTRLGWSAIVGGSLAFVDTSSPGDCGDANLLFDYVLTVIVTFLASIVCDMCLMIVSLNGSIIEIEKRHYIGRFISTRMLVGVLQLISFMFGSACLVQPTETTQFHNEQFSLCRIRTPLFERRPQSPL